MPAHPVSAVSASAQDINPRPTQENWDLAVSDAMPWLPPSTRTVIVAPHPDDETLGCGGLIAFQRRRGVPVLVVSVSDGEAAYPDRDPNELAATRREEQAGALKALGVGPDAVVRCGLPDGRIEAHVDELERDLTKILSPNDLVVAPWVHDHHCDHIACGRAAEAAVRRVGASLVGSLFWAYHHTPPHVDPGTQFLRLDLDDELIISRALALARHISQLPGGGKAVSVLRPELLRPLGRNVELFATAR